MPSKKKSGAKKGGGPASTAPTTKASTPVPESDPAGGSSRATSPPRTPPPAEKAPKKPEDPIKAAEKIKEQGNVKFKAQKYEEAIDLYSEAIELNPQESAYLTNRAAASMALKRFRSAMADCQQALSILSPGTATPSASAPNSAALVKCLFRLAKCQFSLGETAAAMSSLTRVFALEATNSPAIQLKHKIEALQAHIKNFEKSKEKKDWGMARLSLDKCTQTMEQEEWRVWKVELELAKGNWEGASMAANDALRSAPNSSEALTLRGLVLFLSGKIPAALQHLQNALRYDPGHEKAMKLRKEGERCRASQGGGQHPLQEGNLFSLNDQVSDMLQRIGANEEEGGGGSDPATTLLKLNRNEEALEDTEESLKLFPHSFKALRTRARLNLNLENYEACIGDFKSAIQEAMSEGTATDADVRALKTELKKAEAALKRSKSKDYYKILGVGRECTDAEIKKAYRRESLKHHPDKGGDEEKPHAVLSDPQKRRMYDMGDDIDGSSASDMGGMGGMGGMSHMDLADLFAQFHGGGGGSPFGGMGGGGFGGGGRRGGSHGGFAF
ncbi:DnaJ domain-containing protein [Coprinopsis sp. MPI-PUGE-AT-0042]|nr:DnaJ domain-containing protein [Coprinopsis sp. MPI-PUGE-AT-0042]